MEPGESLESIVNNAKERTNEYSKMIGALKKLQTKLANAGNDSDREIAETLKSIQEINSVADKVLQDKKMTKDEREKLKRQSKWDTRSQDEYRRVLKEVDRQSSSLDDLADTLNSVYSKLDKKIESSPALKFAFG